MKKSNIPEPIIQEKLETIVVTSLISLRASNPKIEDLQGTPINTLCRIANYNIENGIAVNGIGNDKDKDSVNLAISYLQSIEPLLRELSQSSAIPFYECNDLFGIKKEYKVLKQKAF